MSSNLSMTEVLESLKAQIAHHREQEAIHAERETFHRERRAGHAAELEQLTLHLGTFEAAASAAVDLAARGPAVRPAEPLATEPVRDLRFSIHSAVEHVIAGKAPHEPFGPNGIAAEMNRRFTWDGGGVSVRQVSVSLRRLAAMHRIVRLEKGRPHWESRYARERPPAA